MTNNRLDAQDQMNVVGRTQAQISVLTLRLHDLQREIAGREAAANDRLNTLHVAIAAEQATLASLRDQHAQVSADHTKLTPLVEGLRKQRAGLVAEAERLTQVRQDAKIAKEELGRLQQSMPAKVQELEQLRKAIQANEQTLEETLRNIDLAKRECGKAQKELEAKRKSLTQEHVALDERWTAIKAAEAELAQRQSHVGGLLENARRSKLSADQAQANASEREQVAVAQMAELEHARQGHQDALKTHTRSQEELQDGFSRLQKRAEQLADAEKKGKMATQEMEELKSALERREAHVHIVEKSMAERDAALVKQEQALAAREQAMRQASLGMAQAQAEVRRLVQAYKLEQAGIVIPGMAPA